MRQKTHFTSVALAMAFIGSAAQADGASAGVQPEIPPICAPESLDGPGCEQIRFIQHDLPPIEAGDHAITLPVEAPEQGAGQE